MILTINSPSCDLKFDLVPSDSDGARKGSESLLEIDEIIQRQAIDDTASFGGRRPPIDVDSSNGIQSHDESRTTRSALNEVNLEQLQQTDPILDEPTKSLPAMDWNAGETVMEAWLNQSAVPWNGSSHEEPMPCFSSADAVLQQETKDVEVLRRVHVLLEEPDGEGELRHDQAYVALPLEAQAHFRKIRDKFPSLESQLVARLAEANVERAQRLFHSREAADMMQKLSVCRDPTSKEERIEPEYPLFHNPIAKPNPLKRNSLHLTDEARYGT